MTTFSKRDRLVEAAKTMFYQHGVTRSTLAEIAQQAQVPLGNVYYHFRTKEALISVWVRCTGDRAKNRGYCERRSIILASHRLRVATRWHNCRLGLL